jgi:hypothetical protein
MTVQPNGAAEVVFPAADAQHLARVAAAEAAARRGEFAEARRLVGIDDAVVDQALYELSRPVAVEEHADASVACALAAASVAELVRVAHLQGYEDVVGVVVVEDLTAPCDEDGGF